ncbi:MAG: hypothetical protein AB8D52_02765 [Gammaproteobacteria bacterium]
MFQSRRVNSRNQQVEVWECKWSSQDQKKATKKYIRILGNEEEIDFSHDDYHLTDAICWSKNNTIGNIALCSEEIFDPTSKKSAVDVVLPCQFIPAGKFRHGVKRWYCKTHQTHWGTKADFMTAFESGELCCKNHLKRMSYVINPYDLEFKNFKEIIIRCTLPPALSSDKIPKRPPQIHVEKRVKNDQKIDLNFDALICSYYDQTTSLPNPQITKIQVTSITAFEFVRAVDEGRELSCVTCKKCNHAHLDLGDYAEKPHRKHFCGNCGNDNVWTKDKAISTPLKPLHDQFNKSNSIIPDTELCLDQYENHKFDLWVSTPAIVWTANQPQKKGLHVHVYDKDKCIINDTFGKVIYEGLELTRDEMWENTTRNTLLF